MADPAASAQVRPTRRSPSFLLICALAHVGGVIGYLPLLTLLLPVKIGGVAGDARIGLFTATVIAGALAASVSNILFGWLSDHMVARGGGRRVVLAGGVGGLAFAYTLVAIAASPIAIVLAVVAFQVVVNAVLAPLFAIMADEIPDMQKGVAGGLLPLANPLASALSALLVGLAFLDETSRLGLVVAAVAACVAPLLLTRARRIAPDATLVLPGAMLRRDIVIAWIARLLVQVAGNALSLYLLYYFESLGAVATADLPALVGRLLTIAFVLPLPIALAVGRVSDLLGRRKPFLLAAAIVAASGLVGMALAADWTAGAIGFCVYTTGSSVFVALHSAFAMQFLPDPQHRGRDLGFYNLTNTLPALLGPLLTWWLATPRYFDAVMLALAGLTLCGGVAMLAVRGRR
ncbi:MFS transporter [Sphingomonas endolithica]|uniref:MFS transporter n=1 Tax=Sphingomonas endolithica TaxID=2972485 RepID=UPI0021AFE08F|nr:MFS transporter [Sphingomonas sp. ZFBP2030]